MEKMTKIPERDQKLSDVAELWARSQGIPIPPRDTPEWQRLYETWVNWAFSDFKEVST